MRPSVFILLIWIIFLILVMTVCTSTASAPPKVIDTWKLPKELDTAGPASCEDDRELFAYDAQASLDIQEVSGSRKDGVTVIEWAERWFGAEHPTSNIQHPTPNDGTKLRRVNIEILGETERRITYEDSDA